MANSATMAISLMMSAWLGNASGAAKASSHSTGSHQRKRRACSNDAAAAEDEGAGFIVPNPRKGA